MFVKFYLIKYNKLTNLWGVKMAIDKELKMQDILSDYYSALAKFENIKLLYESHKDEFVIKETDDELRISIKKAQLNELLVDLGRVGELALKYILKLKQVELYPNQTIEQFRKEALYKKGPLKTLANRVNLNNEELAELLNYEDANNQPFHNFDYLFMIIEKLMKTQATNFYKIIEYSMLSREIKKEPFSKDERRNFEDIVFPEYTVRRIDDDKEEQEVKERIINLRRETIKQSGDIFTRLRYFSNNPQDKEFNFENIYDLMQDIIMSIRTIHECKDDIDYDPIEGYGKIMALENPELTYRPANEVRDIFNLYRSKTDAFGLLGLLFSTQGYTFEQIKAITDMQEIEPKDYVCVFCNKLQADEIKFFFKHGIKNYDQMGNINTIKTKTTFGKFLNAVGIKNKYYLFEMETMAEIIEADKYQNLALFEYLTTEEICEVNKYPNLLKLLRENVHLLYDIKKLTQRVFMDEDLFIKIISLPEIHNADLRVLESLCCYQLNTYRALSEPFFKEPLISEIINRENFFDDMILEHVKENAKLFNKHPEYGNIIPYLLDPEDNKEIIKILLKNGLDIEHFKDLEVYIFYVPIRLTKLVLEIMKKHNIPLIINNQINHDFYKVLTIMMRKFTKNDSYTIIPHNYADKFNRTQELEQILFKK